MFLVIADDFTGAAELAGVAKAFGLNVEIQTGFSMVPHKDGIIIDTNTRSKTAQEAVTVLQELLASISQYEFDFLFKKTDSVLRGHVYSELSVLLEHYPERSILLVPANPTKGRTISNATYFISGRPLHETVFSNDPEAPVKASDIHSLIKGDGGNKIKILDVTTPIFSEANTIYIGEAKNDNEINFWGGQSYEKVIPAGAADFFKAMLKSKKYTKSLNGINKMEFDSSNKLFICGSSLSNPVNIEEKLYSRNPKVVEISPSQIPSNENTTIAKMITDKIINQFKSTNTVILFVNISELNTNQPIPNLPRLLATIVSMASNKIELDELFVEGGTTSSEVIRKMGWTHFSPVNQVGEGVVRMQVVENPEKFLTVKPGSYKWPDRFWWQFHA